MTNAEDEWFYEDLQELLELTAKKKKKERKKRKKKILFIRGDRNAKPGSQGISLITDKFGLGIQNEARQRLTEFVERTCWPQQTFFQNLGNYYTHEHHQIINTKIRLLILFVAKEREALYSQQKQDQELTKIQIISYL